VADVVIQAIEGLAVKSAVTQLSPAYLQANYMPGLDFVDNDGNPYPDSLYVQHINNAVTTFERETKIHVLRRTITDEAHDYYVEDYQMYAFIQLFQWPVLTVDSIGAVYPTGQTITTFPLEWVKLDNMHGQIQLVPTIGTLSQVILGQGGNYLPLLYSGLGYLPQLFRVGYTTGFADGNLPTDIVDAIAKLATISLLSVLGATVFPPGVTNISAGIDGLSQGVGIMNNGQTPPIFSGLITSYRTELYGSPGMGMRGQLRLLQDHYRGFMMRVM
jgi:hypothetical protein